MQPYSIVLVDDEEEVRKGIIRKIAWEELGFRVAGDADNGEEALELIEELEPDVVMTDIRMPYMDGLELARRIRLKYPTMKILIFSGFDDFEYARKAISLGVSEYILKPVNVEELTSLLKGVREDLDREYLRRSDTAELRAKYLGSLPVLRGIFLNELVRGALSQAEIVAGLREYDIDLAAASGYMAAVLRVDTESLRDEAGSSPFSGQHELIPVSMTSLLEDCLGQSFRYTIFTAPSGLTLIAAFQQSGDAQSLLALLDDVCREAHRILSVTATIGAGRPCSDLSAISRSYSDALDALGYRTIVGDGSVIYIHDVEPLSGGELSFSAGDEALLSSAVKFGDAQDVARAMDLFFSRLSDSHVHMSRHRLYLISIANHLLRICQQNEIDIDRLPGLYEEVTAERQHYRELKPLFTEAAEILREELRARREGASREVIIQAERYIDEHYSDPELSVELLSDELHLSQAYFSTLFKKETGRSCVGYITDLRLDKARELLESTDLKTYVIAREVGYRDQNYFSYVFKKKFGVSPSGFRSARFAGR